jgi:hypothetical protein
MKGTSAILLRDFGTRASRFDEVGIPIVYVSSLLGT